MRRPRLIAGLVAVLALLPATAALAHPAFNPDQLPTGERVDATLVVPHGCSAGDAVVPAEGRAVPTTRFDLQQVDGVRVEPDDVDGWDVSTDGEAISWTDAGGATTDPIELPVTVTIEQGSPGDTILLSAYQECEDGSSYRWTEGSDDTPPVRLELTGGEVDTAETDMEDADHGAAHTQDRSEGTSEQATDAPSEQATSAVAAGEGGGFDGATVAAILAIVVAVTAGIVSVVRRKGTA